MPYMKEHIAAGIQVTLVAVGLPLLPYTGGIIPLTMISVDLSVFAATGIMLASDLPEIYAKRSTASKLFHLRHRP